MRLYKQSNSRYWYAEYRDADGIVHRRSTGCRDKGAAQSVLNKWESEAERVKAGIISPAEADASRHAVRPMEEHLADYEAYLSSMQRLASLPAQVLCQGHRVVMMGEKEIQDFFQRSMQETIQYRDLIIKLLNEENGDIPQVIERL